MTFSTGELRDLSWAAGMIVGGSGSQAVKPGGAGRLQLNTIFQVHLLSPEMDIKTPIAPSLQPWDLSASTWQARHPPHPRLFHVSFSVLESPVTRRYWLPSPCHCCLKRFFVLKLTWGQVNRHRLCIQGLVGSSTCSIAQAPNPDTGAMCVHRTVPGALEGPRLHAEGSGGSWDLPQ